MNEKVKSLTSITVLTFAILVVGGSIFAAAIGAIILIPNNFLKPAEAVIDVGLAAEPKAPMAASQDGNNVYVVWWTNKSGNWEVMFRASNDGGTTFGDKINLSNSPETQSETAEILAIGNNTVFVSWWELNENVHPHTNESVMRVSTDGGQTFSPVINLGTNGTITTAGNTTTTS